MDGSICRRAFFVHSMQFPFSIFLALFPSRKHKYLLTHTHARTHTIVPGPFSHKFHVRSDGFGYLLDMYWSCMQLTFRNDEDIEYE